MNRYCMLCRERNGCQKNQREFAQPGCYQPQTQFCRYCTYLINGDMLYCTSKCMEIPEKRAKSPNRCKDFIFCAEDALQENERGYRSRGEQHKTIDGQMNIFDFLEGDQDES